jgi:hypothetical protein
VLQKCDLAAQGPIKGENQTPFEWHLHEEHMNGRKDHSSHIFQIFAQMEWEGCSLLPLNQEVKESCLDRRLSLPPSYPFVASSELFSPHEALFQ